MGGRIDYMYCPRCGKLIKMGYAIVQHLRDKHGIQKYKGEGWKELIRRVGVKKCCPKCGSDALLAENVFDCRSKVSCQACGYSWLNPCEEDF